MDSNDKRIQRAILEELEKQTEILKQIQEQNTVVVEKVNYPEESKSPGKRCDIRCTHLSSEGYFVGSCYATQYSCNKHNQLVGYKDECLDYKEE